MNTNRANPPIIMTFAALDPSGCGGIQADIETAASLGCHATPIVTAICTEGSSEALETLGVESTVIIEQARSILEEMDVTAIKLGFLGTTANAEAVHSILRDYPDLPVVAHPALCLWDDELEDQSDLPSAISSLILPLTTVATFSLYEARTVTGESDTTEATAHALLSSGCKYALITGTGKEQHSFQNSLYQESGLISDYPWQQESPSSHGASSTLATSIAAYAAHGSDILQAIEHAQNFTWKTMLASRQLGFGKPTPHRFFWADKNIETPNKLPVSKINH